MVICYLSFSFLLSVCLFNQVSVQAKTVTDILDEENENVLQALTSDSENIIGLINESYSEQECDCGLGSKGCHYNKDGEKICDCIAGFAQNNDKCEWCFCGAHVTSCTFKNNKKVCNCSENYSQNDEGQCEDCYCGTNSTSCTFGNNKKVCTCLENYFQNDYGKCVECDCGYDAIKCHIDGFFKICTCREGYIAKDGKCEKCDCGDGATSCYFDGSSKVCTCGKGYIYEDDKCESKLSTILYIVKNC
ncbi:matrilin-2-like [Parasteatoda tepidariorum]|uniref:matrilin-2-like n=1 Tax=Parasteatoda tepidariorum TaxID=114398 RepID=UPI0039BD7268